ncbi:hypothetical protein B0H13DRAFT_2336749 [Mycena leptocephala]|nr:hypothetical protein B0H13DRAFT_2336749 [Mycena leptocephala]
MAEQDRAGFPLSYLLLSTATSIDQGKRTKALTAWAKCVPDKYGVEPQLSHVDKDMAEISMIKIRTRLANAKLATTLYNPGCANGKFSFINPDFVPAGQADGQEYEGGKPDTVTPVVPPSQQPATMTAPNGLRITIYAQPTLTIVGANGQIHAERRVEERKLILICLPLKSIPPSKSVRARARRLPRSSSACSQRLPLVLSPLPTKLKSDGAPPTAHLPPLTTAFSCGARAHGDAPPYRSFACPTTSTNLNPNPNTSGKHRSDAYTPSALRRLLGLRVSFSSSSSSQEKGRQQDEGGEEQHAQGDEHNLRAESAALFADLSGRVQSYEDEHLHAQPGYIREDRLRSAGGVGVWTRRRAPGSRSEKSCSPYPYSPYDAHAHAHTHTDPLRLPSLLALLGDVVRAACSSPLRSYSSSNNGRGVRGGWAWGRVGAFVAGVLVGFGVGVWVCA